MLDDSILSTIKNPLQLSPDEDDGFDSEIIIAINDALSDLIEIGIGPEDGFMINGYESKWSDFIKVGKILPYVITYVSSSCKIMIDPPTNQSLLKALENSMSKAKFYLITHVELNMLKR